MDTGAPVSDRAGARATEGHHGETGDGARRLEPVRPIDRAAVAVGVLATLTLVLASWAGTLPAAAIAGIVPLVPAAIVDARTRRLPDRWVASAATALLAAWVGGGLVAGSAPAPSIGTIGVGVAVVGGPILALHLVSPAAMGFGDVKTSAVLGATVAVVDWQLGLVVLAVASATAATTAVVRRHATVAFGPYLVGSAWAVLLASATGVLGP